MTGEEIIDSLSKAVADGDLKSEYELGVIYLRGFMSEAKPAIGFAYICNAAEKGYAKAQFYLGALFDDGITIRRDYRKARFWYQAAAEQGYPDAMRELSEMYAEGKGGKKNKSLALRWKNEFQKAIADDENYSDEEKGFFEHM